MPIDTHTKILATVGPSTASAEMLEKLVQNGADAFRFNFSHGTHEEHAERYEIVRKLAEKYDRHLTIIADLQGPKLRIGTFATPKVLLQKSDEFILDMDEKAGDKSRVCLPHKEIFEAVKVGDMLLLNDGNIRLKVKQKTSDKIITEIVVGGELSAHKGVNLPNVKLPISAITEKDRKDLEFALKLGVDWVCLSFVQSVEDVKEAKRLIDGKAWVISKLEKPSAIAELDEIVQESDGIMVARGDLGVECPIEDLPVMQKDIVKACRNFAKPVIVATQMLESMIQNPTPTRAEVSDVATAVYDGADTVMLSAETAAGNYPAETVKMMHNIITQVEHDDDYYELVQRDRKIMCVDNMADAITYTACDMTYVLPKTAAVMTYTASGFTTFLMARERPNLPIFAVTASEEVARRLGIVWGVRAVINPEIFKDFSKIDLASKEILKKYNIGKKGDYLIITAGYPLGHKGMTNMLHTIEL